MALSLVTTTGATPALLAASKIAIVPLSLAPVTSRSIIVSAYPRARFAWAVWCELPAAPTIVLSTISKSVAATGALASENRVRCKTTFGRSRYKRVPASWRSCSATRSSREK